MGANGAQSPLIGGRAGRFSPSNQKTTDTNGAAILMPEGITPHLERPIGNPRQRARDIQKGRDLRPALRWKMPLGSAASRGTGTSPDNIRA